MKFLFFNTEFKKHSITENICSSLRLSASGYSVLEYMFINTASVALKMHARPPERLSEGYAGRALAND
jgi:hypothetical protein